MSRHAARQLFFRTFGRVPEVLTSAPGRVNLIGEHTDYNGGEVLPIGIERRIYVAAGRAERETIHVVSAQEGEQGEFDPRRPTPAGKWWDYIAGMAAELADRDMPAPGADIAVHSDVPVGAGLSSSAALAVAAGLALTELSELEFPPRTLALLAWQAETRFVGVAVGIMDQLAAALSQRGSALHVWCDTILHDHVAWNESTLIFDTATPRALRTSAFNARREECAHALAHLRRIDPQLANLAAATPDQVRAAALPPPLDRRALHVVEETRRVARFAEALRAGGSADGELLLASHESLRTNYECSCPELDWFVDQAMRLPGVRGARLTGAGWGGCAIAVGEAGALADAGRRLTAAYEQRFKRRPRAWVTSASDGARVEDRVPGWR